MKKLGLIILVLVIAVGSIGIAYANWSQNLTFGGSVSTGTFDTRFVSLSTTQISGAGSISASVDAAGHIMTVNLGAATPLSPGCVETVTFRIQNTGSVPAKVAAINVGTTNPPTLVPPQDLSIGGTVAKDITVSFSGVTTTTTIAAGVTSALCTLTFSTDETADMGITAGNIYFMITTQQP